MYLLGLISPETRGILLKLYTYQSIGVIQPKHNFGCDRSIAKGTLLGEHNTLSIVLRLPFEGFF
jgi:hypothetical protein